MSCTKAVPVITMEKLCEPKLRCSVCDRAREARGRSGDRQDGDRLASPDPKPLRDDPAPALTAGSPRISRPG